MGKKAAGQNVNPLQLPPLKANDVTEHKVSKWVYPPPPEPSPEELAFRARFVPPRVELPFNVEIRSSLKRPHRMVSATLKALRKATYDRDGLYSAHGESSLPIKISKAQVERSARFLDALLRAVEKAGHQVRSSEGYAKPTRFVVDGEDIEFSLKERLIGTKHVLTAEERKYPNSAPKMDFRPSGDLRFKIITDRAYGHSQQWEDAATESLESRVDEIFLAILRAGPSKKASEAERTERENIAREAEHRRQEAEMRQREAQRRADALVEQVQQWKRIQVLRQFIDAVRSEAVTRFGELPQGSSAEAWLSNAKAVADRLAPLTALFSQPRTE